MVHVAERIGPPDAAQVVTVARRVRSRRYTGQIVVQRRPNLLLIEHEVGQCAPAADRAQEPDVEPTGSIVDGHISDFSDRCGVRPVQRRAGGNGDVALGEPRHAFDQRVEGALPAHPVVRDGVGAVDSRADVPEVLQRLKAVQILFRESDRIAAYVHTETSAVRGLDDIEGIRPE